MSEKKPTILIVDDIKSNRDVLRIILEKAGYTTLEAEDGEEGVSVARNPEVKLVLMDINMPNMDGLESTKLIKKKRPNLPVVSVTAVPLEEVIPQGRAVGIEIFIKKPVKRDNILETVRMELLAHADDS